MFFCISDTLAIFLRGLVDGEGDRPRLIRRTVIRSEPSSSASSSSLSSSASSSSESLPALMFSSPSAHHHDHHRCNVSIFCILHKRFGTTIGIGECIQGKSLYATLETFFDLFCVSYKKEKDCHPRLRTFISSPSRRSGVSKPWCQSTKSSPWSTCQ